MANAIIMLNVDRQTYEDHQKKYDPLKPGVDGKIENSAIVKVADLVSDWVFFRFCEGSINSGMREAKYGVSETLGVVRPLTFGEAHNLNSCDYAHYMKNRSDLDAQAAAMHEQRARNDRNMFFKFFLEDSDIPLNSTAAQDMIKIIKTCASTEHLKPLHAIATDRLPAGDVFISPRDQHLMCSPKGVEILAGEITRHAQEGRLAFVGFGDERSAMMFISPEPDGFAGRVRRELARDMPEDAASEMSKAAFPLEDETAFLANIARLDRAATLEQLVQRAPDPDDTPEAEMSL